MEPSRMIFYRFGDTSSSLLWYELAYIEAKGKVKKALKIINPIKKKILGLMTSTTSQLRF
ncbi:hypothetical protein AHAS_Ahas14G0258100 [Arachis hypogaea]